MVIEPDGGQGDGQIGDVNNMRVVQAATFAVNASKIDTALGVCFLDLRANLRSIAVSSVRRELPDGCVHFERVGEGDLVLRHVSCDGRQHLQMVSAILFLCVSCDRDECLLTLVIVCGVVVC